MIIFLQYKTMTIFSGQNQFFYGLPIFIDPEYYYYVIIKVGRNFTSHCGGMMTADRQLISKGAFTNYVDMTRYWKCQRYADFPLITIKEFRHKCQQGVGMWSIMGTILSTQFVNAPKAVRTGQFSLPPHFETCLICSVTSRVHTRMYK